MVHRLVRLAERSPPQPCRNTHAFLPFTAKPHVFGISYAAKLSTQKPKKSRTRVLYRGTSSASYGSAFVLLGSALVVALLGKSYLREKPEFPIPTPAKAAISIPGSFCALVPSAMQIPEGRIGNLTSDQQRKLREFWTLVFSVFEVKDSGSSSADDIDRLSIQPDGTKHNDINSGSGTSTPSAVTTNNRKSGSKKLGSIFSSSKHKQQSESDGTSSDAATSSTPKSSGASVTETDKYGQTKDYQQTLREMSPEELRWTYWSMLKADHPDSLLLRFLRARKWDTQRALVMLVATLRWRAKEMQVDEDIVRKGEGGALQDSQHGETATTRKEGDDFLAQMRKGKSFLHGVDKEGRPLCFVRARLHKSGEQSEAALERYTVHVIETARLVLSPPVETATILFDMSSFTLSNMDYPPVKFMIKVFEANYPESLGAILVHRAPWVFQSIWTMIRGWLDPVVVNKIHFTKTVEDLERFIPRSQIIKELGGDEDWEYQYIEPREGENEATKDASKRDELQKERRQIAEEFENKTLQWLSIASKVQDDIPRTDEKEVPDSKEAGTTTAVLSSSSSSSFQSLVEERNSIAKRLNENYWCLDPYIRARSLYDRQGMIKPDGQVDYYPEAASSTHGAAAAASSATAPTATTAPQEQADVD